MHQEVQANATAKQDSILNSKLDLLISQNESTPVARKLEIFDIIEKIEKKHIQQFEETFNLGYAIVYIDKKEWFSKPKIPDFSIDWNSLEVLSQSEKMLEIILPNISEGIHFSNFFNNSISVPRIPGYGGIVHSLPAYRIIVGYLETINGDAILVVGVQGQPED